MPDLLSMIAPFLNALLIALIARKALGVPVGWPRSIAMGLFTGVSISWAVISISEVTGIYVDGRTNAPLGVVFAVAALVTAWVFVLGLIALVLLELFVPTGTLPSPSALLRGWKARRNRARRYTQVVRIAAKHGLSGYLGGRRRAREAQSAIARSLRAALNEGGVTHSTGRLLVMDRLTGTPVGDAGELLAALPAATRKDLAESLLSEVLRQLVRTGVFHADLHPGNILITPDGGLGLLDFGSVGRLDQPTRNALGMLLVAIDNNDAIVATDSLIEMLDRPDGLVERDLEREIGQLLVRYRAGLGRGGSSGMFAALFKLIHAHGFAVPPQIAGAFRALAALDGTLTLISADLDVVAAVRRQGREMMREATEPQAVRADLESRLAAYLPLLQRLPRRINKLTEDLEQGRISINIRALSDERDRGFLTGLVHQVVIAILAATATLGAIVLMVTDAGPTVAPGVRLFVLIGSTLLLVGFVLALRSLALVFHRR
ncbi:AarF/UbiB family protein [Acrocarpospora catenulata]|uniref:AarF/UbiB family protein n=1 Tax=Acrocarpospora catenulata TaxID=2836182 RepID=UPI001BD9724A|nr:AarF/UbiB family protein [Acrocarpospora catenulata]